MRSRAQEQSAPAHGRGRHETRLERILGQLFEFASGFDHRCLAPFAKGVNPAVRVKGRGGVVIRHALFLNFLVCFRFEVSHDVFVVVGKKQIVNEEQGWFVRNAAFGFLYDLELLIWVIGRS